MRIINHIMIFMLLLPLFSCANDPEIINVDKSRPYLEIKFSFNTDSYKKFIKTFYPQTAVWITINGDGINKTIYATKKGAKENWWGAKTRPSALPVWNGIRKNEPPTTIDSVTGATPSGNTFVIEWPVPENLMGKKIDVFIESNISFDYNVHYPKTAIQGDKNFSDVNGQPSLVWKSSLLLSGSEVQKTPVIIGHGHVLGENDKIDTDLSTITTAKDIFNYLSIAYHGGEAK